MNNFNTAQEAFEYFYNLINLDGKTIADTKTLFNVGFYINKPYKNEINTIYRKWNKNYAEYEWQWYLSGNPDASEISKRAPIWKKHMDENNLVRSNYGWQWLRKNQLNNIVNKLKTNAYSRHAVISIYDGKEIDTYTNDTPCTLSIHFQIVDQKLCMTVFMRSNDLWFGFCNDQYCFSKLQELVANELNIEIGWYYHFASNMHLYSNFLNK
jgi:thymidylate synthase